MFVIDTQCTSNCMYKTILPLTILFSIFFVNRWHRVSTSYFILINSIFLCSLLHNDQLFQVHSGCRFVYTVENCDDALSFSYCYWRWEGVADFVVLFSLAKSFIWNRQLWKPKKWLIKSQWSKTSGTTA